MLVRWLASAQPLAWNSQSVRARSLDFKLCGWFIIRPRFISARIREPFEPSQTDAGYLGSGAWVWSLGALNVLAFSQLQ
jgi:hypothetical protein